MCDLLDLAAEHGTPLFVYDEAHLRARCREAVAAFGDGLALRRPRRSSAGRWPASSTRRACSSTSPTGGELHVALAAGFPADRLVLHGNNKSVDELRMARAAGVGRIVVDSFDELDRLDALHADDGIVPAVLLRVTPGVEAHTHEYVRPGRTTRSSGSA